MPAPSNLARSRLSRCGRAAASASAQRSRSAGPGGAAKSAGSGSALIGGPPWTAGSQAVLRHVLVVLLLVLRVDDRAVLRRQEVEVFVLRVRGERGVDRGDGRRADGPRDEPLVGVRVVAGEVVRQLRRQLVALRQRGPERVALPGRQTCLGEL